VYIIASVTCRAVNVNVLSKNIETTLPGIVMIKKRKIVITNVIEIDLLNHVR